MADEAILRIVLDDKGVPTSPPDAPTAPTSQFQSPQQRPVSPSVAVAAVTLQQQKDQVKALLAGTAMPWAPPSQAIPKLNLPGLASNQAEYLRMESEAMRRGMGVHEYRKAEVAGKLSPLPQSQVIPTVDVHEERRRFNEERARQVKAKIAPPIDTSIQFAKEIEEERIARAARIAAKRVEREKLENQPQPAQVPVQTNPPVDPSVQFAKEIEEERVARAERITAKRAEREKQEKQNQSQPAEVPVQRDTTEQGSVPAEVPVVDDLVSRTKDIKKNIAMIESWVPQPGSLAYEKLEKLREELDSLSKKPEVVENEYTKLKPPDPKPIISMFDALLSFADGIRGTLGGTFGTLVGVGLDVTNKVRRARADTPKAPKAEVAPSNAEQAVVPVLGAESLAPGGMGAAAAVAVVGAVVAAVVIGFKSLINEANKMAERYGEYNPEIAQAQAMAEIRKITGDMRRAQESGGELAEFIKAQSEMQDRWEDVKTQVMRKIIPVITGILEVLSALFGIAAGRDVKEIQDPTHLLLNTDWFDRNGVPKL